LEKVPDYVVSLVQGTNPEAADEDADEDYLDDYYYYDGVEPHHKK